MLTTIEEEHIQSDMLATMDEEHMQSDSNEVSIMMNDQSNVAQRDGMTENGSQGRYTRQANNHQEGAKGLKKQTIPYNPTLLGQADLKKFLASMILRLCLRGVSYW